MERLNKAKDVMKTFFTDIKGNQTKMIVTGSLVLALTAGSGVMINNKIQNDREVAHEIATRAKVVKLNGQEIGTIREESELDGLVANIQDEYSRLYNMETIVNGEITFEDTHVEDEDLTDVKAIKKEIKSKMDIDVCGYSIFVEGEKVVTLKTKEEAEKVIASIKQPYEDKMNKEGSTIKEIKIVEEVKIDKTPVDVQEIVDYEKGFSLVQRGTDEVKTHTVEKGESFWYISKKYGIPVEDLEAANPGKSPKTLQIGDELSLVVAKPYVSVATLEEKVFEERIPFETEYEETKSLYKNEKMTKVNGEYGKKEVLAKVYKINGVEQSKEVVEEKVVKEPRAKIIAKGTKAVPPSKGTGKFIRPTGGKLTSGFGSRGSRFHYGLDLASSTGTPIKAADSGTVTFAGWKGNYVYMIEIDHGGGYKTVYAHCSKLYVKKGQKVFQGKTIGAVGNTGRSTGPHVHFEVVRNGKRVNPSNYINRKYK